MFKDIDMLFNDYEDLKAGVIEGCHRDMPMQEIASQLDCGLDTVIRIIGQECLQCHRY